MTKKNTKVDSYIKRSAPFAQPILTHLRKTILSVRPKLEEAVKWRMPSYLYKGKIVCGIAGFKAHCALWFWKGKEVIGNKKRTGMGNFGRIRSKKDLPASTVIKNYVQKAIRLIDQNKGSR